MRRFLIISAGFGVLAAGLVMVVLPGPAVVVIPTGLAILAKEVGWAQIVLDRGRTLGEKDESAALLNGIPPASVRSS